MDSTFKFSISLKQLKIERSVIVLPLHNLLYNRYNNVNKNYKKYKKS